MIFTKNKCTASITILLKGIEDPLFSKNKIIYTVYTKICLGPVLKIIHRPLA